MVNTSHTLVSLIMPCYNEEGMIDPFLDRVGAVVDGIEGCRFEFLFVDDGSHDATAQRIGARAALDPRVRMVGLSRNFGQQRAIMAGLDFCAGDWIIVLDVDLQDPPELIPEMLRLLREGHDLVHTVRSDRSSDSFIKRLTAKLFYASMRRWVLPELPENAGDFKAFNRRVLDALRQYPERVRFLRGALATLGFRQTTLSYVRPARYAGRSKFPAFVVLRFARDAIVSYTVLPLRLGFAAGVLAWTALPVLVLGFLAQHFLFGGLHAPVLAILIVLVTGFGATSLILLGLIGEYLGVIIREVKQRPLYIVRETTNLKN